MRRYIAAILFAALIGILSGCGFWMDGSYQSVTPHKDQSLQTAEKAAEVSTYTQMRDVLTRFVETGAESGIISVPSISTATVHFYMQTAANYIMKQNPIGAYAVDDITFEVGTNQGIAAVAFNIIYRNGISEILRIKQAGSMEDATKIITAALDNCDDSVVICVDSYESANIMQFVQDYANDHPDIIMEVPQVNATVYPDKGVKRIIEISFTYQTGREDLRRMQAQVETVFTSAELYVKEAAQVRDIYERLYSFIVERNDYTIQQSVTPSYSLLHHGIGDSRAFANVYAAMCRRAELDCQVISGTRDGQPWCWNLVRFRGAYYHVDLLRCNETGVFGMFTDSEMAGYEWDDPTSSRR